MRKNTAIEYFKEIYDATFDDAITYIYGKTGNPSLLNDILYNTYFELFMFIKKQRWFNEEETNDFLYSCLNDMLGEFSSKETIPPRTIEPSEKEEIDKLLDIEFDINDEQAINNLLLKKANSFILQKNALERKIFVLYFYNGFETKRISGLLGVNSDIVDGCIVTLLKEI